MPLEGKILAAIALLAFFLVAVVLFAMFARWLKRPYGLHRLDENNRASRTTETPDAWAESAKRMQVNDADDAKDD